MVRIYNTLFLIIILCAFFSCSQQKSVNTKSEKRISADTVLSMFIDTLNETLEQKYDDQVSGMDLRDFAYEIDYFYDSLNELILQSTDSSNYISVGTDQGEGGMNALWYFNSANEIIRLTYNWAFESQQVELEYFIRRDTVIGYNRIDRSGYCQETQKWCIEKGGFRQDCDKTSPLNTDSYTSISLSFKDYKIELAKFLELPITKAEDNIYWLESNAEETENYNAYVKIPKKLYDILVR